jgi:hypothetical protein
LPGANFLAVKKSDRRPPILLPLLSVNHSAPSGPAVMPYGPLLLVGIGNSVIVPAVVIRPILLLFNSVNHSAPSGPAVIIQGKLLFVVGRIAMGLPLASSTTARHASLHAGVQARLAQQSSDCDGSLNLLGELHRPVVVAVVSMGMV